MSRDTAMEHLHPVFRQRVQELIRMFTTEDLPFRLFEGFRTPHRQRDLYAQGRTRSGNIITKAQPWGSYHQYGVAGDFVLNIDGQWSWDDSGERGRCWNRLHEFAHRVELETLSWERPHLQLKGLSVRDLRAARYPAGGDDTWVDNLESAIHMWQGVPAAPLVPISTTPRPPLDSAAIGPVDSHDSLGRIAEDSHVFRVIARSGLRLRAGPGASFDVIDTLTNGQLVSVVATSGEWRQVDLEGDGLADGYCHAGFLAPVV